MNLNTNRGIHMRKGKFLAHQRSRCQYWVFLFLEQIVLILRVLLAETAHLGVLRTGEMSSGEHFLCFNFTVGMRVHQ